VGAAGGGGIGLIEDQPARHPHHRRPAKVDRMAKQVLVDEPWAAEGGRVGRAPGRGVARQSGIRTPLARDLFEMAIRGLFPATSTTCRC
jgi:hypothetical protein